MNTPESLTFHHKFKSGKTMSLRVQRIEGSLSRIIPSRKVESGDWPEFEAWAETVVDEVTGQMTPQELVKAAEYAMQKRREEVQKIFETHKKDIAEILKRKPRP